MVAGALGLVLSLLFWSSFSPYRRTRTVAGPDTVVEASWTFPREVDTGAMRPWSMVAG
jgi:hypothetical protein